ncbi:MAG: rod-binding protein [Deltaproteobacteria bacterium]|jgi:flagellar protein FlgJ
MNPASVPSQIGLKIPAVTPDKLKDQKLRKACADFEAIMLRQLLATMRKSVPKSGLLDGGYAGNMYRSIRDEQLAHTLSQGKGVGFGEALYRQLSRQLPSHSK